MGTVFEVNHQNSDNIKKLLQVNELNYAYYVNSSFASGTSIQAGKSLTNKILIYKNNTSTSTYLSIENTIPHWGVIILVTSSNSDIMGFVKNGTEMIYNINNDSLNITLATKFVPNTENYWCIQYTITNNSESNLFVYSSIRYRGVYYESDAIK